MLIEHVEDEGSDDDISEVEDASKKYNFALCLILLFWSVILDQSVELLCFIKYCKVGSYDHEHGHRDRCH